MKNDFESMNEVPSSDSHIYLAEMGYEDADNRRKLILEIQKQEETEHRLELKHRGKRMLRISRIIIAVCCLLCALVVPLAASASMTGEPAVFSFGGFLSSLLMNIMVAVMLCFPARLIFRFSVAVKPYWLSRLLRIITLTVSWVEVAAFLINLPNILSGLGEEAVRDLGMECTALLSCTLTLVAVYLTGKRKKIVSEVDSDAF